MSSARSLLQRVTRLEQARAPVLSPFERAYGSLDDFERETLAKVEAGALDRRDLYGPDGSGGIMRSIRIWHEKGLFGMWHRDRTWKYDR